jgi:hypothetical protein
MRRPGSADVEPAHPALIRLSENQELKAPSAAGAGIERLNETYVPAQRERHDFSQPRLAPSIAAFKVIRD